jgi:hypothetical protein
MPSKVDIPHHEIVTVLTQPPRLRDPVAGREGIVVGRSDPYEDGHRDYAVHFNHLGQVRSIPEDCLRAEGRQARPDEVVTRSSVARGRRGVGKGL